MKLLSSKLQSRLARRAVEIREVELEWYAVREAARQNANFAADADNNEGFFKGWAERYYEEARELRIQANALGKDQKLDKQLLRLCYHLYL